MSNNEKIEKMRTFNVLNSSTGTYVRTNAKNVNDVAKIILKLSMLEEDFEWKKSDIKRYLNSYVEFYSENEGREYSIDETLDTLTDSLIYASNKHIIQSWNKTEVDHDFKESTIKSLYNLIQQYI